MPDRIASLDLIRGIAVLGILAVNIAGFAGGAIGTLSPNFPEAGSVADNWAHAGILLVFEGKLRALFTLMFGASMLLFIERAEERGRDGQTLQLRRLFWLMLFGYLHFVLLWWGDILFTYALIGLCVLPLRNQPLRAATIGAVAFYLIWHGILMVRSWPDFIGNSAPNALANLTAKYNADLAVNLSGFWEQALHRLTVQGLLPLDIAISSIGETASLMVLGMVLYRSGFFAGEWPRRRLQAMAAIGIGLGGLMTVGLIGWTMPRGFPPLAMFAILLDWSALPHLLMGLGYIAALMLAAPWLISTRLGDRLVAAGRMAFSNYIATTIVMTFVFHGWGMGLGGQVGTAAQFGFVLLGWGLMLGWSQPWLARYRQGPLEWLWRSLVERRRLAFIR